MPSFVAVAGATRSGFLLYAVHVRQCHARPANQFHPQCCSAGTLSWVLCSADGHRRTFLYSTPRIVANGRAPPLVVEQQRFVKSGGVKSADYLL